MAGVVGDLSERESQILSFASKGFTDKEIARQIGIGPGTVKTYWTRIRGKLGAGNRTEAVASEVARYFASKSLPATTTEEQRLEWWAELSQSAPFCFVVVDSDDIVLVSSSAARLEDSRLLSDASVYEQLPDWLQGDLRSAVMESRETGLCVTFASTSGLKEKAGGFVAPIKPDVTDGVRLIVFQP